MMAKAKLLPLANALTKSAKQRNSFLKKIAQSSSVGESKGYLMSAAKSRSMTTLDYSAVANAHRDRWITGQLGLFEGKP